MIPNKSWNMIKVGGYLLCDDFSDKKQDAPKMLIQRICPTKTYPIDNFYMDSKNL